MIEDDDAPQPPAIPARIPHVDAVLAGGSAGEPWPGYRTMRTSDLVRRLAAIGDREILARVTLFEAARGGRPSVVEAARSRLAAVAGLSVLVR